MPRPAPARGARPPLFVLSLSFLLTGGVASACSSAAAGPEPAPGPEPRYQGVPGFDTRSYPGDAAMAQWRARSPYRWVGYYLPAPCFTDSSWTGRRAGLERMGWGTAVIFVGEQDWAAGAAPAPDSVPARCTRANLTRERGRSDGAAAHAAARAEGFPGGTVVYLDVERVESVSPELAAYVEGWTEGLIEEDGYVPGLYAHGRNARELLGLMEGAAGDDGTGPRPRLWVAWEEGFDLTVHPSASGFDEAHVWQGAFDVEETWGDTTLRIDRNVARSRAPSG